MRTIKVCVETDYYPSAGELARCFWSMSTEEQADFFHALACVSEGRLPFQLQSLTDSPRTTSDARWAMRLIGEYADDLGEADMRREV